MLTLYDLMLLKEKYAYEEIIYIAYRNHDFVFRLLSPREYSQATMLSANKEELHDVICQLALIYPENYEFVQSAFAGFSTYMAQKILEISLIGESISIVEEYENQKEKLERFLPQCKLIVKAAFPEYSLDAIEEMSYKKLMELTAKGEFILKLQGSTIEGISYDKEEIYDNQFRTIPDLINSGIDPMFYYADELKLKKDLIDYPLIMGSDWRNEEVMKGVRRQIYRR